MGDAREPAGAELAAGAAVAALDREYERLHVAKEDAFWTAMMGLAGDREAARAVLEQAELALQAWLTDPARLAHVRALEARAGGLADDERTALEGWRKTLAAHCIDSARGRSLAEECVAAEGRLEQARATMALGYRHPETGFVPASSVALGTMLRAEPDARLRRAAWDGLRSIEEHVLAHGFLELVKLRNRLGRELGGEDYYDWKVRRVEGMTKAEVFALLDELEARTRAAAEASLVALAARHAGPIEPWDAQWLMSGDATRALDPYFPFAAALDLWGRSFAALGIRYRGATLVLDLLDRPGKYENGFMHGPVPAWRERGRFKPARIQFTANAIPGMVGAGVRALETLFHEGGHAAHFANIDMPSPCFAQEYAPSSVAFAETQSMLLDGLVEDPGWRARYARSRDGEPIPLGAIELDVRARQPFAAWQARSMLAVCYAEKAIYELPEAELTTERVLQEVRAVERRLLFLAHGSPRPVLSVPHLLSNESSAYYHGYVLAEMAVEDTRLALERRFGTMVDAPGIGPLLAEAYWKPGNSRGFGELVRGLTGGAVSAANLAQRLSRPLDQALDEARARYAAVLAGSPDAARAAPVDLDAAIRVVHGRETLAELARGDAAGWDAFQRRFAGWIGRYSSQSRRST